MHDFVALLLGPLIGVGCTFLADKLKAQRARKEDLFKVLIKTARNRLSQEHVAALNLIQTEFHRDFEVMKSLKRYFRHLNEPVNAINSEEVIQFNIDAENLFSELMQSLAKALGYASYGDFQVFKATYAPQGWLNSEGEAQQIRHGLLQILTGVRGLPIEAFKAIEPNNPFPPPPSD